MQNVPNEASLGSAVPEAQAVRYRAEGSFKAVYEATINQAKEALKVIYLPEQDDQPDARTEVAARITREIESLRRLTCPYVVKLGSLAPKEAKMDGHEYLIYSEEFLEGPTLADRLGAGHRPALDECVSLMNCLLHVITDLKGNDLIHRDIKPGNIVNVGHAERAYVVLDLGVAFKLHSSAITMNPDMRQGTLPYMAPEMFVPRFRELLDYRSDLYSAAVTVYQFAAGVHPIARRGEDDFTTMYRIATMKPAPLNSQRTDFPPRFCGVIDSLMRKKPALRPANLSTLRREMEELS
jgi:serine/threonine protein kinase